ncbi:hypothetical protein pkur_cds_147 [Pandoravirus kuranda]|uniref:F-box domain containing protein n=1 Tax=Pandoravirus kuranda TaxID=3019033 RepID=A0AA95J3F1_9VIRU|nr:hypothetical protein pkur_cds_147 [Pandoravirus kuranda]
MDDDSDAGFATGLLGGLDDADCLVHILRSLSLKDYMALALISKRTAAFLVEGTVLRATWGVRLGVDGRFDPQFGPHQCETDQGDPCVPFTVPRAWRRAAQVSAACADAAHLAFALYKRNTQREEWDADIDIGSIPSVDDIALNVASTSQQEESQRGRRFGALWIYRWKARWLAAVEARAPGALHALALMLVCLVRMRRTCMTMVRLEPSVADAVKETIGIDFYDVHESALMAANGEMPDTDIAPEAMAENAMLSYQADIQVVRTALAHLSPHATACVARTHAVVARLLVKSVDLWEFGFHSPTYRQETVSSVVRSNLIIYSALRTREIDPHLTAEARDLADDVMLGLVPRALRLDAQRLMIACSGIDNVLSGVRGALDLSLTRGAHTSGRNLAARMAGATHQEALDMLAETVPYVCALASARSVLVSPPAFGRHSKRRTLPHAALSCSSTAAAGHGHGDGSDLVAWVRLWSLSMGWDLAQALANINLLNTRNIEPRQYSLAAFDAALLIDMIRAWRTSDNARLLCEDIHANMVMHSARLAVLSWATAGGIACMKQLCDLVDSKDDIAWLLSSDGCRDLAVTTSGQTSDAVNKLASVRSHMYRANIRPLHFACASTPYSASDNHDHFGADDEAIASLRVVVGRLSSMTDAFAWCLAKEGLIDQETTERVHNLAVYVKMTHEHAASILAAATKTKAAA